MCIALIFIISFLTVIRFEQRKIKSFLNPVKELAEKMHFPDESKFSQLVNQLKEHKKAPVLQLVNNITKWSSDRLPKMNRTYQSIKNVLKNQIGEALVGKNKMSGQALISNQLYGSFNSELVNYDVHIFYYPWYLSEGYDGRWKHWNHNRLPYWKKGEIDKYSTSGHTPVDDIAADFYPELGPYSSNDPSVIKQHMKWIKQSGAGRYIFKCK